MTQESHATRRKMARWSVTTVDAITSLEIAHHKSGGKIYDESIIDGASFILSWISKCVSRSKIVKFTESSQTSYSCAHMRDHCPCLQRASQDLVELQRQHFRAKKVKFFVRFIETTGIKKLINLSDNDSSMLAYLWDKLLHWVQSFIINQTDQSR